MMVMTMILTMKTIDVCNDDLDVDDVGYEDGDDADGDTPIMTMLI